MSEQESFSGYAIVELMGHQTFAGYVSERPVAGAGMLQIDVPEVDAGHPAFTKLFSPTAIYGLTPTTEENARRAAAQIRVRPVTLYILPEPVQQLSSRPRLIQREVDRIDIDEDEDRRYGDMDGDDDEIDDPDLDNDNDLTNKVDDDDGVRGPEIPF